MYYPNIDLVNINAYTKFGKIPSICYQDFERKRNYDDENNGCNDGQPKSSMAPLFLRGAKLINRVRKSWSFKCFEEYILHEKRYRRCLS